MFTFATIQARVDGFPTIAVILISCFRFTARRSKLFGSAKPEHVQCVTTMRHLSQFSAKGQLTRRQTIVNSLLTHTSRDRDMGYQVYAGVFGRTLSYHINFAFIDIKL